MSDTPWPELQAFLTSSRSELKLTGPAIVKHLENSGLQALLDFLIQPAVVTRLTDLEISEVPLAAVPSEIAGLSALKALALSGLGVTVIPADLAALQQLSTLVLGRNMLATLPPSFVQLTALQTLTLSHNQLEEVPFAVPHLHSLVSLDLTSNRIHHIPESLCRLTRLARLQLGHNDIAELPSSIGELVALRTVDLSGNRLQTVPPELAQCPKLKELDLSTNPLTDKKIVKLADSGVSKTSDILKLLRGGSKTKVKAAKVMATKDAEEASKPQVTVLRDRGTLEIVSLPQTRSVRPYLLCCIVRGLEMNEEQYKTFISLQTAIHEGIAEDRTRAVLGTHDMTRLQGPLLQYECRRASAIRFQPLKYSQVMSGTELLTAFETDVHMKRHLKLVTEADPELAFLTDMRGEVLSLLPLVNSEYSKCSIDTRDCLIECSSANDFAMTRQALDALLTGMHQEGILTPNTVLEVVRVVDESGTLRAVYPSKTDLPDLHLNFQ